MSPSALQLPVHRVSSPLQGQATRGPTQRALPGTAALRQSLQAEDAATPLAAGLRFGAWVDALGPHSELQAPTEHCQEEASCARGGYPAEPQAGSADGSARGEAGCQTRRGCGGRGGSAGPARKRSPAESGAVRARPYGSGGPPWQPARAAAGTAAAPASGNPFAGLPAGCAAGAPAASPETLAHGNPFRRATAPKAGVSSGSS